MFKIISLVVFVILVAGYILYSKFTENKIQFNPNLKFVKQNWAGNPIDENGNFINHEFPMNNSFWNLLKWQLSRNPQKDEKNNENFSIKVNDASKFLTSEKDGIVWLGHATFLIRLSGKLMITDPVFGSPIFFQKRHTKLPFPAEKIKNIDFILQSHDHPDHLNFDSQELLLKNNPNLTILAGLRTGEYIANELKNAKYEDAAWYQTYSKSSQDIKITFMPARHWSARGILDRNTRLWGAFVIQNNSKTIYFGGDSGYGSHFKEVKDLFGKIDYAIIGIGAYKPEWFMGQSHTSPKDALLAADNMQATNFIPMHYGTFDLSDEPLGDPIKVAKQVHQAKYKSKFSLLDLEIGEIIYF